MAGMLQSLIRDESGQPHPAKIGRTVSISSTMKSKNADTLGVRRNSCVAGTPTRTVAAPQGNGIRAQ